nr:hypothetical protein [Rhizobium binae]
MDPALGGQAAITPISYQQIIAIAYQVGLDKELWRGLSAWVERKIVMAAAQKLELQEV